MGWGGRGQDHTSLTFQVFLVFSLFLQGASHPAQVLECPGLTSFSGGLTSTPSSAGWA